jgi:hypothetical protein
MNFYRKINSFSWTCEACTSLLASAFAAPLNDDANALGTPHGAFFVERQAYPWDAKLLTNQATNLFSKGLNQLKLAVADKVEKALGHCLVVESVINVVRGGSL